MHRLDSGIQIDEDTYHQMLDWKDKHMQLFKFFCMDHGNQHSINQMDKETLMALIGFIMVN